MSRLQHVHVSERRYAIYFFFFKNLKRLLTHTLIIQVHPRVMAQQELYVHAEEVRVLPIQLRILVQTHLLSKRVVRARLHAMQIMSLSPVPDVVRTEVGSRVEDVDPFNVAWMMFRASQTVRVSRPL